MNWIYKGKEIKDISQFPEKAIGFVYLIENLNTGQYECIDGEIYGDGYIGNDIFLKSCIESADNYTKLIESGRKPQDAREVLNLATKTQLIMTGFKDDWDHFFELRCANNAHPDAQYIANKAKEEIYGNQGRSN